MSLLDKSKNILIVLGLYALTVLMHSLALIKEISLTDQSYFLLQNLAVIGTEGFIPFLQALIYSTQTLPVSPLLLGSIAPLWGFVNSINSFLAIIVL